MLCAASGAVEVASASNATVTVDLNLVHAILAPGATTEFFARKQACYARFSAQAASVQTYRDEELRQLFLVIARVGGMQVGGVAIYLRSHDAPLPLESAIGAHYAVACSLQHWQEEGPLAELSGLWIERDWRKSGLSRELMLAAMAAVARLGIPRVLGFSHQHVLDFYGTIGLRPHTELGQFEYPDARYRSTVVSGDCATFSTIPQSALSQVTRYRESFRAGQSASCALTLSAADGG